MKKREPQLILLGNLNTVVREGGRFNACQNFRTYEKIQRFARLQPVALAR